MVTRTGVHLFTTAVVPVTAQTPWVTLPCKLPVWRARETVYLKRQLENFRTGVRGNHQDDNYGHQMVLMARSLQDEQSVNDLLAYLNTL